MSGERPRLGTMPGHRKRGRPTTSGSDNTKAWWTGLTPGKAIYEQQLIGTTGEDWFMVQSTLEDSNRGWLKKN